ncbi:MAG TPA: Ku protein [Actinomycetota bacterium]|nr:Ku protein [Actinomycetota bacterium]
MRTMWKGAISFGLVSIPVRVFPATEEKSVRFNQLHAKDHGRIKYQRVCAKCGEEVPYQDIVRGYEYEKDRYVVLEEEELDSIPVESSRTIDIDQFVDITEIDPIYFQKTYYLIPEEAGVKAYALLREALADNSKVGIAKVSFREKEHLATIRVSDHVIVLETMYWPDEIRKAAFEELDKQVKVRPQEVQMARSLIENLTGEWDPDQYGDEYRQALIELIEKKVAGEEIEYVAPPEEAPKVVDLMEALRASVEATKKEKAAEKPASKKAASSKRKRAAS